jgi:coenzyme PQQ precursor peptide PqqA
VTGRAATGICRATIGREEVSAMESVAARSHLAEWEAPEFEEIGCAAEVTMYVARLED